MNLVEIYNLLKDKKQHTVNDLLRLREKIGSGNNYIACCIQFPNRPGSTREQLIIEHYEAVRATYKSVAKLLTNCKSSEAAVKIIQSAYPRLGPFRMYEVYTSLTYCDGFALSENDYLFIGPGSKDVLIKYAGGHAPNLDAAIILADKVDAELRKRKFNFNGHKFTVRTLEDGFCEFRKYLAAKDGNGSRKYYPDFFPRPLRYAAHGAERESFKPIQKSEYWLYDGTLNDSIKLCASEILPPQAKLILKQCTTGQILTKAQLIERVKDANVSLYFPTLVDLKFFLPTTDITKKGK